jgi:glutamate-1-semialdehyde aminotransferase
MRDYSRSLELYKRARNVIPGGAQTLSKMYGRFVQGAAPAFLSTGVGAIVGDIDDNQYIDWAASLGAVILGHRPARNEWSLVPLLSLSHPVEVNLAEKLCEIIPCAEMVRFFKTGSEATSAAVRLARAVTGRESIVCCGYHGWHDWYASILPDPKSKGILHQPVITTGYGELWHLEELFSHWKPACFILEPMSRQCPEKANAEYLQEVRRLCNRHGIVLVFDEMIMGFRYAMAGGQELYGVVPDLACFGKAMSNGWPLSCLVGRREMMRELEYMQVSGTYCGEILSIVSALDTIGELEREGIILKLWEKGERLKGLILWVFGDVGVPEEFARLKGFGPWSAFVFGEKHWKLQWMFLQEVFEQGIFYGRDHFMMAAHEDWMIDKTVEVYRSAFIKAMRYFGDETGIEKELRGKVDKDLLPR